MGGRPMRCFVRWPCCAYACAGRAAFSGEMPARRASHAGEASCLQTSAWIQRDMRSVARDNTRGNVGPTQRWHRLHECLSSHTHATNPWGRAECGHAWASATGAVGWTAFVSVPRRVASGDSVVTQKICHGFARIQGGDTASWTKDHRAVAGGWGRARGTPPVTCASAAKGSTNVT